jgi:hypothetical protein
MRGITIVPGRRTMEKDDNGGAAKSVMPEGMTIGTRSSHYYNAARPAPSTARKKPLT